MVDSSTPASKHSVFWVLDARALVTTFSAFAAAGCAMVATLGWHDIGLMYLAAGLSLLSAGLAAQGYYKNVALHQEATRELAAAELRVRGILESAMDPIVATDVDQHIILFNGAAEKAFGRPRSEVLGQRLDLLIPERFRSVHGHHIERFGRDGITMRRMGGQAILTALRADGTEFPIDASISQYSSSGAKFFTVILRDVTERVRAEEALLHSKQELSELANAANFAREQEKTRIARELHDELAQALTALKMDIAWARKQLPESLSAIARKLSLAEAALDTTVGATRRIAADLRPLMLDDLGLVAACEWLAERFTERSGIPCDVSLVGAEGDLPPAHATAIFRILQESLANIARHADATAAEVLVEREAQEIILQVTDNGAGFVTDAKRDPASFGLLGVRERAYMLGGEVVIESAPGKGTAIRVHLPLAEVGATL